MEVARFARLASRLIQDGGARADDSAGVVPQRLSDAVALQYDGAGGLSVPGKLLVEAEPRPDESIRWEIGHLGPRQFDSSAAGDQPQALVPAPALVLRMRQAK